VKPFSNIEEWVSRLFFIKNDSTELNIRKKFLLITNLIAIFFISLVTLLAYSLHLKHLVNHVLLLLAFTLVQTILLLIFRKWSRWFIYAIFSLYIILIFYIIISLGGIANSAGLLMAAYFFLLTAQWMEDTRLLLFVGVLYVIGVLAAGISFPYLKIDAELIGWKNNLFFAINFGWIGLTIALALYSTIVKSENVAKNRAEQLQELNLLKSNLYSNLAHEFRTPLTIIKTNAEEIGKHFKGQVAKRASSIVQNSEKILFLINQMINLSKAEEESIPVYYVQSDLVAFLKSIVDSFRDYAAKKEILLHYEPGITDLTMDMDTEKLEESISNLLSNAIKYTPEGGDVFVSVELQNSEQPVQITIRDTGIGIPENELDKIFIRFYRVEDKRFPYSQGTGIGLTLVNEYIKIMNGSIQVHSVSGEGSEFIVSLPYTKNTEMKDTIQIKGGYTRMEAIQDPHPGISINISNYPRLLIIEDNQEMIEYLSALLQGEYQIIHARNGTQGAELAKIHIPDIILSDVMMPEKDGYQVCRELKNDIRTDHIPVILLTAKADYESRITGLECGADAYLTKPFDKKELMVSLHSLFVQREKLRLKYQSGLYEKIPEKVVGGTNTEFLSRVIKILEENYRDEKLRIKDLYMQLGISRIQLHRKLTALTGQSTSNFIHGFRLFKARRLLVETDRNVSEIAYEVGYADPNYFSRVFTHEHGIKPSELRNSVV
jgi:signal transduction histidine kinase/DNA-binding response OmpR family regulator